MTLYVKEYEWMWNDLRLSLAECRIFAYIHGLTHGAKGGYDGSKRHLAELLGLNEKSVRNILNTLMEKNLILCTDGLWRSAELVRSNGADSVRENAELLRENADSVRSPHSPLYNNITDKKQADMQENLFEKFFKKFAPAYKNRYAVTKYNWEGHTELAQQAMWDEVKDAPDGSIDKNPFFFVVDFPEPQPVFLRGDEPDEDIVQVKYKGRFKFCARQTMQLFGLEFVRDWKHVKN